MTPLSLTGYFRWASFWESPRTWATSVSSGSSPGRDAWLHAIFVRDRTAASAAQALTAAFRRIGPVLVELEDQRSIRREFFVRISCIWHYYLKRLHQTGRARKALQPGDDRLRNFLTFSHNQNTVLAADVGRNHHSDHQPREFDGHCITTMLVKGKGLQRGDEFRVMPPGAQH